MATLLDKVLEHSLKKGWITQAEFGPITQEINRLSAKWSLSPDFFVKMAVIEAEGFNPRKIASNGCIGVTQVCSWGTVWQAGAVKLYGGPQGFANIGTVKQLQAWDKYHMEYWVKQASRPPKDLGELYATNLFPAAFIAATKGKLGRDEPIRLAQLKLGRGKVDAFGKQAMILYSDYNVTKAYSPRLNSGNSEVTLNSLERGLNLKVLETLGKSVVGNLLNNSTAPISVDQAKSLKANPSDVISQATNILNSAIQSVLLSGKNCPPPEWNQRDRIIYSGCKTLTSAPLLGNALGSGYAAPAVNSIGASSSPNTGGNSNETAKDIPNSNKPYEGTLKPGGFVNPMKKGTYTLTSSWGPRWGKQHRGVDLAAPIGTPLYATADGKVISVITGCPINGKYGSRCGGGYGNQVIIQHAGTTSICAHMSTVLVKEGDFVKQGQQIGAIGNSGSSTGAHTHFEIRPNGVAQDPSKFIKF